MGSSLELVPLASRSSSLSILDPASGTALWADLWTVPAHASEGQGPSPLLPAWFEFGLTPSRIRNGGGLQHGASPLQLPEAMFPGSTQAMQHAQGTSSGSGLVGNVIPEQQILRGSEFLLPLDEATTAMYRELLQS